MNQRYLSGQLHCLTGISRSMYIDQFQAVAWNCSLINVKYPCGMVDGTRRRLVYGGAKTHVRSTAKHLSDYLLMKGDRWKKIRSAVIFSSDERSRPRWAGMTESDLLATNWFFGQVADISWEKVIAGITVEWATQYRGKVPSESESSWSVRIWLSRVPRDTTR